MIRSILCATAALSLGGCTTYGYDPYASGYADGYYTQSGLYCPPGYYCDNAGRRELIRSGNYGYSYEWSYHAPTYNNYNYERQRSRNSYAPPSQHVSCPAGYVSDGAGCALAARNNAPQGWNRNGYRDERYAPRDTRQGGRPANQSYTPYDYGNQARQSDHRTVERRQARNGSNEQRTVERRQSRNSDRRDRSDRSRRQRND